MPTYRVLVVDDVKDVVDGLVLQLRVFGYEATGVSDPRDAIARAIAFGADAALLDIGMPHINGYQLAPMLRKALEPKPIRIAAITAWGTDNDREMSKAAGFDMHIVKPVDGELLNRSLRTLLAQPSAKRRT